MLLFGMGIRQLVTTGHRSPLWLVVGRVILLRASKGWALDFWLLSEGTFPPSDCHTATVTCLDKTVRRTPVLRNVHMAASQNGEA